MRGSARQALRDLDEQLADRRVAPGTQQQGAQCAGSSGNAGLFHADVESERPQGGCVERLGCAAAPDSRRDGG
jgi:hypothetical protein